MSDDRLTLEQALKNKYGKDSKRILQEIKIKFNDLLENELIEDAYYILHNYGLEPDYIDDLIDF